MLHFVTSDRARHNGGLEALQDSSLRIANVPRQLERSWKIPVVLCVNYQLIVFWAAFFLLWNITGHMNLA